MLQDNKKYIIYKHTNLKNNKIYIGQTCQKPQDRWGKEGAGYKGQMFYSAIQKYGWNNFSHEILYTNLSLEEANHKEAELIQKYQTTNSQYGYNIEKGGNNKFSFQIGKEHPKSKQVICLNTHQIFDTEKDAAIWMNQDPYKSHIAEACQNKRLFCGIHPETKEPLKKYTTFIRANIIRSLNNNYSTLSKLKSLSKSDRLFNFSYSINLSASSSAFVPLKL